MRHKKVLIFGASQGIGKALAYEYSFYGAELVLLSRNEDALRKISEELKCAHLKCDISLNSDVKNSIDFSVKTLGKIELIIINSGLGGPHWITDFTADEMRKIYEVNVFGIGNVLEHSLPVLREQGFGTIVGISSLADVRGYPGSGIYSSSKAAASVFLEASRVELKKYNIEVITVRPGFVRTAMTSKNEFKMPLIMSAERAAIKIRKGIEAGKSIVQFPYPIVILTRILKILPNFIFDRIMRYVRPEHN